MSVPQSAIDLLKIREGFKQKPYRDSLDKLTVGWGHLMSDSDVAEYGDHVIGMDTLEEWLACDAQKAYDAACNQAKILGVTDQHFIDVLTSVCYQLGTSWFKEFNHTWALLKVKRYEEAAENLERSAWYKQTPTRVKDFQQAIRSLIKV